jgi:PAS domain S-box-containing protein
MKFFKYKKNDNDRKLTSFMKLSVLIDRCFFSALIIAFFALAALFTYLYFQAENNAYVKLITKVKTSNISLATFIHSYFDDVFNIQDKLLKDFSHVYEKKSLQKTEKINLDYLLSVLNRKYIRKIIFLSPDAEILYSAPQKFKQSFSLDYTDIIQHLNQKSPKYIYETIDQNSQSRMMIVASAYYNEFSVFSGVICFILDTYPFDNDLAQILNDNERMWVFNQNKKVVLKSFYLPLNEKLKNNKVINNLMTKAIKSDNGVLAYDSISELGHKEEILVSFSSINIIPNYKWIICTESFTKTLTEETSGFPVFYSKPMIIFFMLLFALLFINRYFIRRYIAILEYAVEMTNIEKNKVDTSLASILHAFPYILFETDCNARFSFVNAPHYAITGIRAGDMIGKTLYDFTVIPQNELNFIYDRLINKKDSINQLRLEMNFPDSNETKYMSFNAVPVIGDHGKVITVKGVLHDISERVKLETELVQAKKQDTMGMIISGIAHDFNNYLTSILGYIDLIKTNGYNESIINKLQKSAKNASKLTGCLLAFSKNKKISENDTCNKLNDILMQVLDILRIALPSSIKLNIEIEDNLPTVKSPSYHIEQIIMNLIINARDAMPNGGKINLTAWTINLSEHYAAPLNLQSGDYVIIKITDSGSGLDEEMQKRIFEPYFTTKDHGTGVGLASVRILVKHCGGNILVKSKPGKGSEFALYIPVVH